MHRRVSSFVPSPPPDLSAEAPLVKALLGVQLSSDEAASLPLSADLGSVQDWRQVIARSNRLAGLEES